MTGGHGGVVEHGTDPRTQPNWGEMKVTDSARTGCVATVVVVVVGADVGLSPADMVVDVAPSVVDVEVVVGEVEGAAAGVPPEHAASAADISISVAARVSRWRVTNQVTCSGPRPLTVVAKSVPFFDLGRGAGWYLGWNDAGWSSLVARRAHNPKVGGSNPPPATKKQQVGALLMGGLSCSREDVKRIVKRMASDSMRLNRPSRKRLVPEGTERLDARGLRPTMRWHRSPSPLTLGESLTHRCLAAACRHVGGVPALRGMQPKQPLQPACQE